MWEPARSYRPRGHIINTNADLYWTDPQPHQHRCKTETPSERGGEVVDNFYSWKTIDVENLLGIQTAITGTLLAIEAPFNFNSRLCICKVI